MDAVYVVAYAALQSKAYADTKYLHHPVVGDLDLQFEALHLPGDDGHRLLTYSAVPGSSHDAALQLLQTAAQARTAAPARRAATTVSARGV